jgi:hypothetical protein
MVHNTQDSTLFSEGAEKPKEPGLKQQRRLFFFLFFLVLTGTFLLFFSKELARSINSGLLNTDPGIEYTQKILIIVSMAIFFAVTGYFMYTYLSGHYTLTYQNIQHIFDDENIEETTEIAPPSIEKHPNPIKAYRENKEREELKKQLDTYEQNMSAKVDELTTDLLLEKMDERFGTATNYKAYAQLLGTRIDDSKHALSNELNHARKNAAINLVVGIFFSIVASVTLVYTLLAHDPLPVTRQGDLYSYIPQLILSLFIAFFSFFFIRLYRKNMQNIRHLTNELTSVGLKILSLNTAVFLNDKSMIKAAIEELHKTERSSKK